MARAEDLDAALSELDQLLAEVRQVITVFRELPHRARRLRQPLRTELRRAHDAILRVLDLLSPLGVGV